MHNGDVPIGSFAFWFVWKVVTILVLVILPLVAFSSAEFPEPMRIVFVLILLGIMIISNEELVYGHAAEDGIHFRRYFNMRFLPWNRISSIKWSSSDRIEIRLKTGFLFRKQLSAQSFGARNKSASEWLSTPPEVVRWLLVSKPYGAEGIELIGPGL
jgi:hypothetical protein